MNCREAQHHLFAEDGAPRDARRAAFAEHAAQCAACRQLGENLARTIATWRDSAESARVPDAELEWQKLRREIRGGTRAAAPLRGWRAAWLTVPLAAAAALATMFFTSSKSPSDAPHATVVASAKHNTSGAAAKAGDSGNDASTLVYVDDKSGWTFVWAPEDGPRSM
ncbi:MAG TPA: hypothetical protein VHD62_01105 [Opitutaceae bacterium]|nr:hypothetical protein [Opitutaceae bacterium]